MSTETNNSLIVSALIKADGTVKNGNMLSCSLVQTGIYDINFNQDFSDTPIILAKENSDNWNSFNAREDTRQNCLVLAVSKNSCRIATGNDSGKGNLCNKNFSIIAIDPSISSIPVTNYEDNSNNYIIVGHVNSTDINKKYTDFLVIKIDEGCYIIVFSKPFKNTPVVIADASLNNKDDKTTCNAITISTTRYAALIEVGNKNGEKTDNLGFNFIAVDPLQTYNAETDAATKNVVARDINSDKTMYSGSKLDVERVDNGYFSIDISNTIPQNSICFSSEIPGDWNSFDSIPKEIQTYHNANPVNSICDGTAYIKTGNEGGSGSDHNFCFAAFES